MCGDGTDERRLGHVHVESRERERVHADVQQRVHKYGERDVILFAWNPFGQHDVRGYTKVSSSSPCSKDR